MKFDILNRWTMKVQFTAEIFCDESASIGIKRGLAVRWAISNNAVHTDADLTSADLTSAVLTDADLTSAVLTRAVLTSADLTRAVLTDADLTSADLTDIKKDFFERLSKAIHEAVGLYDYLVRGKVSGSSYEGECACFCGTIAKIRNEPYNAMTNGLGPDSTSPTEKWFFGIQKGDTPLNNQVSAITVKWLKEFMIEHEIIFPDYKLISSDEFPDAFKEKVS